MKMQLVIMQEFYALYVVFKIIFIITPIITLSLAGYLIIFTTQKTKLLSSQKIDTNLAIGAVIATHKNTQGTIIQIYQHSVIIEQASGEKIEVHKQAIKTLL